MKSLIIAFKSFCILIMFAAGIPVFADWNPGDEHKMHSPQLPNENGWDICLDHQRIADDFQCSRTAPIEDIHFWVSWKGDEEDFANVNWNISIHEDSFGKPGESLWTLQPGNATITYRPVGEGDQGWFCPTTELNIPNDHITYYQVNFTEITDPLVQNKGNMYWLVIQAVTSSPDTYVGWKTSDSSNFIRALSSTDFGRWVPVSDTVYDLSFVITGTFPTEVDVVPLTHEAELVTPIGRAHFPVDGTMTLKVFFEGPVEGQANDDDGDTLDEVDLDFIDLNCTGINEFHGLVELREHPNIKSYGEIEENMNITPNVLDVPPFGSPGSTADIDLVIYLEIEFGGQVLYANLSTLLRGAITYKPPGAISYFIADIIQPLLDADGNISRCYFALGPHWLSPTYEVDPFEFTRVEVEIITPMGPEVVELSGFSSMYTVFEGTEEGLAEDNDGDNLDDVETEMAALQLTGESQMLGPITMSLRPNINSYGLTEEQINYTAGILDLPPFSENGSAESFFDIFFELEINGELLHNIIPLHWADTIEHKPPKDGLYTSTQTISLVDINGLPSDFQFGTSSFYPGFCGDNNHLIPIGDFNLDCIVNFLDLAVFADHWLECTRPVCPW